jgi:hypothetical protein
MDTGSWLGVTHQDAFQFFLEHLRELTDVVEPPANELSYNASVLAHFATTSTSSQDSFPACPASLTTVFDQFVMDRSQHVAPDIMEAAAAQCLLLTGFFQEQQRRRHQIAWYAGLGMSFYLRASIAGRDRARSRLMETMSKRFEFWRVQQHRLAVELREEADQIAGLRPIA